MRIASGVTDQLISFVAVDSTDFATRETGLSSFTVYRSRNGGTATAMTTPTVAELDATNMAGVYTLLLDEDMTIGSGNDTEEMVFHITATGMAPVTRTIELFAPTDVAAALATYDAPTKAEMDSGFAGLNDLSAAQVNAEVDTAIGDAALATAANLATVDSNVDAILVDTGTTIPAQITGLNDLSAADVNAEVDTALADYDGPTKAEMDSAFTEIKGATFSGTTDSLEAIRDRGDAAWSGSGSAPTVGEIADAVWDEAISGHLTAGSTGASLNAAGGSGDPWVTSLPGSYTTGQAGKILSDILTDTGTTLPATLATIDGNVDAVLLDTDDLQSNQGDWLTATGFATAASITALNDFNPATDTVDVGAINGSTEAAVDLALSAGTIVVGAAETGTLSTTQMTSNLTEATDDHYNGRIIIWTSGVLEDQATNITDYEGATGLLTFTAVTEAPSNGDTFVIV